MWISQQAFDLITALRSEAAALRAERDTLKAEVVSLKANFNWLTSRVNALEVERAMLIKKAFDYSVAVPEIARSTQYLPQDLNTAIFEDIGDELAQKYGMPLYAIPRPPATPFNQES